MKKLELIMVCGEEAVNRIAGGEELMESAPVFSYEFDSEAELSGFIRGVNAASGWLETYMSGDSEWEELKGKAVVKRVDKNDNVIGE